MSNICRSSQNSQNNNIITKTSWFINSQWNLFIQPKITGESSLDGDIKH